MERGCHNNVYIYIILWFPDETPCPVFNNTDIVQQPADLLSLTATYINAATSFIKTKAG